MKERDKVLLQQLSQDKLSMWYDPQPDTVVAQKSSTVALQHGTDPQILRNVSHVWKLHEVDSNSWDNDSFPVARAQGPENQPATRVVQKPQRLQHSWTMSGTMFLSHWTCECRKVTAKIIPISDCTVLIVMVERTLNVATKVAFVISHRHIRL